MKFTITQTDTFEVEAATAQEAYNLFIDDQDRYFTGTMDRSIEDQSGVYHPHDEQG